jgi:phenylacetic acid degradation operon negative regulatory protein
MSDRALRPRAGNSGKALLLTVLGEFALPRTGSMWTSTIVEGLRLLDIGERNARQAVARLGDRQVVGSERLGRRTRWHLTESGAELLRSGAERIYGFGDNGTVWDSRWLVVVASVPEEQRAKRNQLRSRLEFAGFGFLGSGIAVSPHTEREHAANTILRELELQDSAAVWLAETGSFVPDEEIIRRAWDLDDLASRYRAFVNDFEARRPKTPDSQFAALVELVHAWRRFPFYDPEIPDTLLPPKWPGHTAKRLFDARHQTWARGAGEWFAEAEASEGPSVKRGRGF